MSPIQSEPAGPSLRRNLWIWGAVVLGCGLAGGLTFMWLGDDRASAGAPTFAHALTIGVWVALGLYVAWMRWRPRKAYDRAVVRARVETFQSKRWLWLVVMSAFIALMLVPVAAWEAIRPEAGDTPIDRLFEATLFLGPCALTLGMMTTTIYSRQWSEVVDDELTAAHRARAFGLGFVTLLVAGAGAYVTALLRPDWALAALPVVIGAPVVVAALCFALLERAAQVAGE